jgi:uncharacterized membrane protein (UPF0127 family)
MKKLLIILMFATIFTSASCKKKLPTTKITIERADKTTIDVIAEIAKTPEERNYGFMNRKKIPDGTGMIFIFEQDQILSFWMKNTPHPLSIAYIDSKGKIRNIFDMTPYSLSSVVSTVSVRYALEVPQGWFKNNNIQVGDTISLDFLQ